MDWKTGFAGSTLGLAALLGGCGPADGVAVEPLPPLERPAPEARAGLPAIQGDWRFAGWEVANEVVGAELGAPAPPGDVRLQLQRIDSLTGLWVRGEAAVPFVGEVRRDGVVSLVAAAQEGVAARFAAGRVQNDTLWIELATLPVGDLSPPTVRWAFVRGAVGQAWLRLPTGQMLRDTVVAEPARPASPASPAVPTAPAADPAAPAQPVPDQPAEPAPEPPAQPRPLPEPADPQPGTPPAPPPGAAGEGDGIDGRTD